MAQRANPATPGERGSVQALVKKVPRGFFYSQDQDEANEDSIRFYQNSYTARASASKGIPPEVSRDTREKRKKLSECFTGLLEEEYDTIRVSRKTVKEVIWESGNA